MRQAVWLLGGLVLAVAVAAAQAAERVWPDLPPDVVAVVEVADVGALSTGLAAAAHEVEPAAQVPPLGMMLPAMAMKTYDATTVDLTAPVRLVLLAPPQHTSPVLVFAVPDPDRYLGALMPQLKKAGEGDGLTTYTENGAPLAIAVANGQAALGKSPEAVAVVLKALEAGTLPAEPVLGKGHLTAAVRVGGLLAGLRGVGQNPFDLARSTVLPMAALNAAPGTDPGQVTAILGTELDGLEALAESFDAISLSVEFGPEAVMLTGRAQPVAGSALQRFVVSTPRGGPELLGLVPEEAVAAVSCKVGDMAPFFKWVGHMMAAMSAGDQAGAAQLADLFMRTSELTGDEMVLALGGSAGELRGYIMNEVTDAAAYKEAEDATMAALGAALAQAANMGGAVPQGIERGVDEHAGVQIDALVMGAPAPPPGMPPEAIAAQERAMQLLIGDDLRSHLAYAGNTRIYVQGSGSLEAVKRVIDGRSNAAPPAALAEMLARPEPNRIGAAYVSLSGTGNLVLEFLRQMVAATGQPEPPALTGLQFEDAPPVTVEVLADDSGTVEKRVTIPTAAVRAIAQGVQQAMGASVGPVP